ncbi:hypothetical protein [Cupriavidus plantarum]|uniref:hypothetical protein n=1 Tax=Cupriavidus plantarum TaxID=942865 RepID=UPI0017C5FD05|nr:hypothetical protein [Cupriavidus plantarum]NYI02759.1 serine transporter [Cupriavidus plantarum]
MEISNASVGTSGLRLGWSRHDTLWVFGIYGCAVGGGSLVWPVSLGINGFWPMLLLSLLAFPMTYLPYRALSRFVLVGSAKDGHDGNVLDTTIENFGAGWGKVLTSIYFFVVFPGMMIYTIIITNTIIDFATVQLKIPGLTRWIVAPVSVAALMCIVRFGTTAVVRTMGYIVAPFVVTLVLFSFILVPHWNIELIETAQHFRGLRTELGFTWEGLPLTVFAFAFTSILSQFVVAQKRHYGAGAEKKTTQILLISTTLIVTTILLFAWSCNLALSPRELIDVKASNLTVLSFLARKFDTPVFAYASQLIVFTAVIKAFLAHYIATEESARAFGRTLFGLPERTLKSSEFSWLVIALVFVVTTASAIFNLDVIKLITVAFVPLNVFVVYFLPLYGFFKIEALKKYRWKPSNLLVAAIGIICLVNGIQNIIGKFFG